MGQQVDAMRVHNKVVQSTIGNESIVSMGRFVDNNKSAMSRGSMKNTDDGHNIQYHHDHTNNLIHYTND